MALDKTTDLAIAELAIYVVLLPVTGWLMFQHGRRAIPAYFYLSALEVLRIVAAALQISAHSQHTVSIPGAIIDSVGLSPLILSYAGFLHELDGYHAPPGRSKKRVLIEQLLVHTGAIAGIALAATGGAKLASPQDATAADLDTAHHLQEVGSVLLLAAWSILVYLCLRLCRDMGGLGVSAVLMVVVCLLIGVRAVYAVVYAFDHSSSLNPVTGEFAVKLVFIFLVQLAAVVLLLVQGAITRHLVSRDGVGGPVRRGVRDGEYAGASIPLESPK